MYLLDTNVWLERLLDQERSNEVGQFLDRVSSEQLFITDFAFHSIGVVLTKLNKIDGLICFVKDASIEGATVLVHLEPEDIQGVIDVIERFNLDFDDAY